MACPTIQLDGVTRDVWQCLRQRASGLGITFPPADSGSVSSSGAEADYAWNEAAGTLSITFHRTPPLVSCGMIETAIRQAASSCGA